MTGSRTILTVLLLVVALSGCGGENEPAQPQGDAAPAATTQTTTEGDQPTIDTSTDIDATAMGRRPAGEEGLRVPAERARIVAGKSEFGEVLFDANGQVVYAFENDRENRSACTSAECVKAWPPVLTREQPSAGAGADARRLGTIRRSDGMLQVTYNGRPLYFYEHEAPGEIRCHNIDLHGGLWWVVTPRGEPAA